MYVSIGEHTSTRWISADLDVNLYNLELLKKLM